jgi:hypothetical protein
MGGVGKVIGELAEKEAPELIDRFLSKFESGQGLAMTARDVLKKTEPGTIMLEHLDNTVIPQSRKTMQAYADAGIKALPKNLTPEARTKAIAKIYEDAKVKGWGDVKSAYLGKKDEGIIKTVHDATKAKGVIHGDNVADALTYVLHDAGEAVKVKDKYVMAPGWRTRKVMQDVSGKGGISLADVGIRPTSLMTNVEPWERSLRTLSGWMNAPLIAIPHIGQMAGVLLNTSVRATAKALADYGAIINGADDIMAGVMKSGVLFDELNYDMQRQANGLGLFEKLFHFPGFSWVRKQELTISALSGKYALLDAAQDLARDHSDKWARHVVNKLGIQVDELAEKGFKPTDEHILTAMYKEANRTIQITRELDVPWKWHESAAARIGFQFKSFAYQYGRMLGTTLQESYKYGGPKQFAKTLTVFATLFPAMGELIHSMENLAQFKDPFQRDYKGMTEFFDALGHVGGLGIFYSLWRSGLYYKGRGFLEGPVVSNTLGTAMTLGYHGIKGTEALLEGDTYKAKRHAKEAARDTLFKLGWPGRIASQLLREQMKDDI